MSINKYNLINLQYNYHNSRSKKNKQLSLCHILLLSLIFSLVFPHFLSLSFLLSLIEFEVGYVRIALKVLQVVVALTFNVLLLKYGIWWMKMNMGGQEKIKCLMLNTEINNLIWNDKTILQRNKAKESGISFLTKTPLKQHYPLIQINERNKEATIPLIDEEEEGKEEKTNNTLNVKATTPSNTFLMSLQLRTKGLRFQILFNELLKRYVWDWWIQTSPLNSK